MKTQKDKPQERWNQTCGKKGHPCHDCLSLNLVELIRDEKQIRQEAVREALLDIRYKFNANEYGIKIEDYKTIGMFLDKALKLKGESK